MHKKLRVTKRTSPVNGMIQYFIQEDRIEHEIKNFYILCKRTNSIKLAYNREFIDFNLSKNPDFHVYLTIDHTIIVYQYKYFAPENMFAGGKKYKKIKITSEE